MQLKVSFSFFIVPKIVSRKHVIHCLVFFAELEEAGQAKEFAASDILEALEDYFLETLLGSHLAWLKPSSLGRTFVLNRQLS